MNIVKFLAKLAMVALMVSNLSGCLVAFGPSQANPNSFGVLEINMPKPAAITVTEREPDGRDYQFRISCRKSGETLGYEWYKDNKGQDVRRWKCQDEKGEFYTALRAIVGNSTGNGGNLSNYCQPNGCQYINNRWVRN